MDESGVCTVRCTMCGTELTVPNPPQPPTTNLVVCSSCGHRFGLRLDPEVWDSIQGGRHAIKTNANR